MKEIILPVIPVLIGLYLIRNIWRKAKLILKLVIALGAFFSIGLFETVISAFNLSGIIVANVEGGLWLTPLVITGTIIATLFTIKLLKKRS